MLIKGYFILKLYLFFKASDQFTDTLYHTKEKYPALLDIMTSYTIGKIHQY